MGISYNPYGYGRYTNPWFELAGGLQGIGQILAQREMQGDRLAEAQAQARAAALAQPGAMTFEEAVASGMPIENLAATANADIGSVQPRFAVPEPRNIPLGTTGKSITYQPKAPVVLPSGVVQTDVGPMEAINNILLQRDISSALGPMAEATPWEATPEGKEYYTWKLSEEAKYPRAGAGRTAGPAITQADAYEDLKSQFGADWDPVAKQFRRYETPDGQQLTANDLWTMAGEWERTGVMPRMNTPIVAGEPVAPASALRPEVRSAVSQYISEMGGVMSPPTHDEILEIRGQASPAETGSKLAQQVEAATAGTESTTALIDSLVQALPLTPKWNLLDREQQRQMLQLKLPFTIVDSIMKRLH